MSTVAYIEAEVKDRNGKVIARKKKLSRSFVRGWNHLLCAQLRGEAVPAPAIQTKDTSNTLRNVRGSGSPFYADAPIANSTYGCVVGTDNTPVDIENYALGAQCAEGVGLNQMNHQACTATYLGVVGTVSSFKIERTFLNNSGNAINVEEIGLYNMMWEVGAVTRYFMTLRDLFSLAVPDGGGITVTYTIRIVA